ncbi:Naproline symporter Sensor histidine kinase PrlS CDS [Bradyrhizobium sp.]|nr:Naproline symporter Sensor histidine kinase PrlS CDS [Bradyrhizobium sp.]
MLHDWGVIAAAFGYIGFLFLVASHGDRRSPAGRGRASGLIYPLSLAIYCTSWTFFGSVGFATRASTDFLAIYVGPILMIGLGAGVLRRVIQLAKAHNITSIADFIGARYGKSQAVAATVALIAIIGSVPYIALQLKAVASSLETILSEDQAFSHIPILGDMALMVTLAMAAFAVLFGTRQTDATEHQHGLMLAVATESIIKLIAFLAAGIFVTFWMFSPHELIERAMRTPEAVRAINYSPSIGNFLTMTLLSLCAIMLLPRQFHVSVVENSSDAEVSRARWLFPFYLVAINLFVIPIALAGLVTFPFGAVEPDMYVLALPMEGGAGLLSVAVFVGGLSAATAMVIVECVALSIMVSNDLVVPLVLQRRPEGRTGGADFSDFLLRSRRLAIFAIMVMAYFYYRALGNTQLAAIGLLSFAAIAQLAPSFFGGLLWRRATARGAIGGMLVGFAVWLYTLFIPSFMDSSTAGILLLQHGPFGIEALRPQALFGADLPPLMHGVIWSLSLNILTYVLLSLARRPSSIELVQADLFVPNTLAPISPNFRRWRTTVTVQDIQTTVAQYLGPDRARHSFEAFSVRRNVRLESGAPADFELLQHAEHLIASSIGAASSRLVMSLLLRKRTVSAKAALKLLDDSHAALHFNREILQTALNHVRQGIAVFDADLQLICSNRQFGDLLNVPPHFIQFGTPLREILEFMGVSEPDNPVEREAMLERRLAAYTTDSEPYLERLPDRHMVIEILTNRMPGGGFVITFTDVTPTFEAAEALERANATLEKRVRDRTEELTRLNSELALAKSAAEDASISKTRFLAAASHDILQPLNAARLYVTSLVERQHSGEETRRDDDLDLELQDGRFDALAGDRVCADRTRQEPRARLRALLAAGRVRSAVAAAPAPEPDLQRDQIHPARTRAGRLPPPGPFAENLRLRHRRRHPAGQARRDLQGIPPPRTGRADRPRPWTRPLDRRASCTRAQARHRHRRQQERRLGLLRDGADSQGDHPHRCRHQRDAAGAEADLGRPHRLHRERRSDPRRHAHAAQGLGRRGHRGRRPRGRDRRDRRRGTPRHRPAGRLSPRPRQRHCRHPRHPPPLRRRHPCDPDHRRPQPRSAGRRARGKCRGAQQAGEAGLAPRPAGTVAHAADGGGGVRRGQ